MCTIDTRERDITHTEINIEKEKGTRIESLKSCKDPNKNITKEMADINTKVDYVNEIEST